MPLEETISQVQENLRKGNFPNEAAVSTGAVLPLLNALGWPVFNPSVVTPEYAVEGRRVDYALRRSNGLPVVFLEVKRVGVAYSGERQLFEYAFHRGVPLAVLTDGQEWNFYLPAGEGDYQDRRVYKLDLLERDQSECSYRLNRYLSYADVTSGLAYENAQSDNRDANREREIERTMPRAWNTLLSEADDSLADLLADKVTDLCGFKPDTEICAEFLSSIAMAPNPNVPGIQPSETLTPSVSPQNPNSQRFENQSVRTRGTRGCDYTLHGQRYDFRNANDLLESVFEKLIETDSTFAERFAARKHGRIRRYLAQDKYELYPDDRELCERDSRQLKVGWFVSTNWNNPTKAKIIRLACEVAGLEFGKDLVVNFG